MKDKISWKGKLVLITGGASGIGKLMGEIVLKQDADLIIWDINEVGGVAVMKEFSSIGKVIFLKVDLSNVDEINFMAKYVTSTIGTPDIIINNAGVVTGNMFSDSNEQDIQFVMGINAYAPMYVTLSFINSMIKRNSGAICNISSMAGLISNPRMSVYAASKWALIGWSDSLRLEMEITGKNISVTTVMPYYIDTGMFTGVGRSFIPLQHADFVAGKVIESIEKRKAMVTIPMKYWMIRLMQGLLGVKGFDLIIGKWGKVYQTMKTFTGRK